MKSRPPQDNWIPASRKPTESADYIVALKDSSISGRAYYQDGVWYSFLGDITDRVTHWQPLPKPPKQIKPKKGK